MIHLLLLPSSLLRLHTPPRRFRMIPASPTFLVILAISLALHAYDFSAGAPFPSG